RDFSTNGVPHPTPWAAGSKAKAWRKNSAATRCRIAADRRKNSRLENLVAAVSSAVLITFIALVALVAFITLVAAAITAITKGNLVCRRCMNRADHGTKSDKARQSGRRQFLKYRHVNSPFQRLLARMERFHAGEDGATAWASQSKQPDRFVSA